jgi:hypothetical protein
MVAALLACIGVVMMVFATKTNGTQRMNIFVWGVAVAILGALIGMLIGGFGAALLCALITLMVSYAAFSILFRKMIAPRLYERPLTFKDISEKTLYYRYSEWSGKRWKKRMVKKYGEKIFDER